VFAASAAALMGAFAAGWAIPNTQARVALAASGQVDLMSHSIGKFAIMAVAIAVALSAPPHSVSQLRNPRSSTPKRSITASSRRFRKLTFESVTISSSRTFSLAAIG
jgi:hypothetical protein